MLRCGEIDEQAWSGGEVRRSEVRPSADRRSVYATTHTSQFAARVVTRSRRPTSPSSNSALRACGRYLSV
jgi:hypothetical protein